MPLFFEKILGAHDQQAIYALVERMYAHYGQDIQRMGLFGSKPRGDSTPDSDIDVLVVTSEDGWSSKNRVFTIGARASLDYDVLFNLYPVAQEHWDWMGKIRHPLYRVILHDGLTLTSPAVMARV